MVDTEWMILVINRSPHLFYLINRIGIETADLRNCFLCKRLCT